MKIKDACFWKKSYNKPTQHIKMQRHQFADKVLYGQGCGFSSSHVQIWELHHKESWALKNWWFWTVVLEKTLESPLVCKEIKPVNPKGNQSWIFTERTDAETKAPAFWPPDNLWRANSLEKTLMLGKIEGRRRTWVWASSGRWWRTGKTGVLQSMGSQRVGHDWLTDKAGSRMGF